MKKLLFLFVVMLFSAGLYAQNMTEDGRCAAGRFSSTTTMTGFNQIPDFTITDSDGVTHNLYESLDQGMTIMLDLFFST